MLVLLPVPDLPRIKVAMDILLVAYVVVIWLWRLPRWEVRLAPVRYVWELIHPYSSLSGGVAGGAFPACYRVLWPRSTDASG